MLSTVEQLLILTKTYPTPSTKYRETTCVAAFNQTGDLRRIFPVPFRLLEGEHQFTKWEWIQASLTRAKSDNRPESFHIDVDTILRTGNKVNTNQRWAERRRWIEPQIIDGYSALESRRQTTGQTLGFLRPARLLGLEITPVKEMDWTEDDEAKLLQDGLFDSNEVKARPPLKKLPYDFHYHYESQTATGIEALRHKITDWEVGALFWNCWRHGEANWEQLFRQKLEVEFSKKDLLFLMGTVHRFPDQWLIVGLVYPPKPAPDEGAQLSLELGQ